MKCKLTQSVLFSGHGIGASLLRLWHGCACAWWAHLLLATLQQPSQPRLAWLPLATCLEGLAEPAAPNYHPPFLHETGRRLRQGKRIPWRKRPPKSLHKLIKNDLAARWPSKPPQTAQEPPKRPPGLPRAPPRTPQDPPKTPPRASRAPSGPPWTAQKAFPKHLAQ